VSVMLFQLRLFWNQLPRAKLRSAGDGAGANRGDRVMSVKGGVRCLMGRVAVVGVYGLLFVAVCAGYGAAFAPLVAGV
jgi:hypothetical protein